MASHKNLMLDCMSPAGEAPGPHVELMRRREGVGRVGLCPAFGAGPVGTLCHAKYNTSPSLLIAGLT